MHIGGGVLSCAVHRCLGQAECALGSFLVTEDVLAAQVAVQVRRSCSKVLPSVHEALAATAAGAPVSPYLPYDTFVALLRSMCTVAESLRAQHNTSSACPYARQFMAPLDFRSSTALMLQ